jgi:hypothetical protein
MAPLVVASPRVGFRNLTAARAWRGLSVGSLVRVRSRTRHEGRVFFAKVTWVERRAEGVYFGWAPVDPPRGHYGLGARDCGSFGATMLRFEPQPFSPIVDLVIPGVR